MPSIRSATLTFLLLCAAATIMMTTTTACRKSGGTRASAVELEPRWYSTIASGRAAAEAAHKPALLYFCAEWAQQCVEYERKTFADPDVKRVLAHDYITIRIDCTDDELAPTREAMSSFGVQGLPTIIVLAPDFKTERLRVNDLEQPHPFLTALRKSEKPL